MTDEWAEGGLWKSTADSVTFGDKSQIHHIFKQPTIAVFHTRFFWMVLPKTLSKKLKKIIGAKSWGPFAFVDCARRAELPDLTFVLAGRKFLLTPYDYIVEQNESGRISCLSSFWAGFENDGVIFLGSAFLKAWATVWDWEHGTIECECLDLRDCANQSNLATREVTKAVHII
ncbi:hypothetical protein IFR05_002597 [Cadophora sp. M221]|nr:hypothetical protein IFR05_002597 [Cadophora sp. M221]